MIKGYFQPADPEREKIEELSQLLGLGKPSRKFESFGAYVDFLEDAICDDSKSGQWMSAVLCQVSRMKPQDFAIYLIDAEVPVSRYRPVITREMEKSHYAKILISWADEAGLMAPPCGCSSSQEYVDYVIHLGSEDDLQKLVNAAMSGATKDLADSLDAAGLSSATYPLQGQVIKDFTPTDLVLEWSRKSQSSNVRAVVSVEKLPVRDGKPQVGVEILVTADGVLHEVRIEADEEDCSGSPLVDNFTVKPGAVDEASPMSRITESQWKELAAWAIKNGWPS